MRLFLPNGEPLGIARWQGRGGLSPHSLKTRRAIRSLEKAGVLSPVTADPLETYLAHLTQAARTRRAAANELARVRRERGEHVEDSERTERLQQTPEVAAADMSRGSRPQNSHRPVPSGSSELQNANPRVDSKTLGFQLTIGAGIKIHRSVRRG